MRSFAIFLGFFAGCGFLFGLEFLDTAELVDEAHLTSEEGVAFGADVDSHGVFSRAGHKRSPTGASDCDLVVGWMNACFHNLKIITDKLCGRKYAIFVWLLPGRHRKQ